MDICPAINRSDVEEVLKDSFHSPWHYYIIMQNSSISFLLLLFIYVNMCWQIYLYYLFIWNKHTYVYNIYFSALISLCKQFTFWQKKNIHQSETPSLDGVPQKLPFYVKCSLLKKIAKICNMSFFTNLIWKTRPNFIERRTTHRQDAYVFKK